MTEPMAVQVTVYLKESDRWQRRPLHLELLNYLRAENVYGAAVFHAVAGFTGRSVLPKLKEMCAHRLIVRENVVVEQGSLK